MKTRNWVALGAGLLLSLAAAYGAYTLADYSWNQVVDYRGPYAAADLPPTSGPPRSLSPVQVEPGRCVFVIVDGLREDVSRTMPALENLRAHGYDAVVRTAQPSLSFPNWTTLLTGAPQRISGVTTNWFEGRVPVETVIDVALDARRTVVVSAPTDFEMLYGVQRAHGVFLRTWTEGEYMSGEIVDHAIELATASNASLVIVHLPDIDEAGHTFGGASTQYRDTALKVDSDLGRLVTALQSERTTFIVASDHGHDDTGGHGGPEAIVTDVPAVFAGPNVMLGKGEGTQDQVAGTVAVLAGLGVPRDATGRPLDAVEGAGAYSPQVEAQQVRAYGAYIRAVTGTPASADDLRDGESARRAFDRVTQERLASERDARLPIALGLALLCIAVLAAIGVFSWRALAAAAAGTLVYYLVDLGLYFVVHGYRWSLSSFNSESLLKAYLNGRMTDAIIAGVIAAAVAADVYLVTRARPKRPRGEYLPGWLSLGVATTLAIQATLGLQVAWYLWWWGASVSWYIPDLSLGFKYDLDLVQITALGAVALLAPVVTYLVGRYHPLRRDKGSAPEPAAD